MTTQVTRPENFTAVSIPSVEAMRLFHSMIEAMERTDCLEAREHALALKRILEIGRNFAGRADVLREVERVLNRTIYPD